MTKNGHLIDSMFVDFDYYPCEYHGDNQQVFANLKSAELKRKCEILTDPIKHRDNWDNRNWTA